MRPISGALISSAVDVDRFECPIERFDRAASFDEIARIAGLTGDVGFDVARRVFRMPSSMPSGIRRDAKQNLEEPCADAETALLERVQTAERDEEDLLRAILELVRPHAKTAQIAPNERHVRLVERAEVLRAERRTARRSDRRVGAPDLLELRDIGVVQFGPFDQGNLHVKPRSPRTATDKPPPVG